MAVEFVVVDGILEVSGLLGAWGVNELHVEINRRSWQGG